MGLDMYLYRKEYLSTLTTDHVGAWNVDKKTIKDAYLHSIISNHFNVETEDGIFVEICVAYWRKANAIHGWFVNLSGGIDECQPIIVKLDELIELRELANSVVLTPAMSEMVLPPQGGFFFGSQEVDEYYLADMKRTVVMLDKIISNVPPNLHPTFVYQASW